MKGDADPASPFATFSAMFSEETLGHIPAGTPWFAVADEGPGAAVRPFDVVGLARR